METIVAADTKIRGRLRIRILPDEVSDVHGKRMLQEKHRLEELGYQIEVATEGLLQPRFDVDRFGNGSGSSVEIIG